MEEPRRGNPRVVKLYYDTLERLLKYKEHDRETWDDLVNKAERSAPKKENV